MTRKHTNQAWGAAAALMLLAAAPSCSVRDGVATTPADLRHDEARVGIDSSPLCRTLGRRFVGLPRDGAAEQSPPLAGRLWIDHCRVTTEGPTVRLRLGGPAWYWLDHNADGFQIRQNVALHVEALLTGEFSLESEGGIASLHFRPTASPVVDVHVTNHVDVEPQTFWASVVDALPFALVPAKAKRRIGSQVATRFERRLDDGATFTVDLRSGETDMALGHLAAGKTPRHPFHDGRSALVNERQLLHPGSAHVVGPFEATDEASLDVLVERGDGIAYEVACAADVERTLAEGAVLEVDPERSRVLGRIQGAGLHHASVTADGCEWVLVTTSSGAAPSLAALRIRAGASD